MTLAIGLGRCWVCHRVFTFNAKLVPAIRDQYGEKQPVCGACIAAANVKRREKGLAPIEPLPGAYEPADESEL